MDERPSLVPMAMREDFDPAIERLAPVGLKQQPWRSTRLLVEIFGYVLGLLFAFFCHVLFGLFAT